MSVYDDFPKVDQYGREVVQLASAIDGTPLPVLITGGSGGGGDASAANQVTEIAKLTSIDSAVNGTLTVGPIFGASTSALQTAGNGSLSNIDNKTPALGQALAAASVPVILPSATITTLTPPAAITGFALETSLSSLNGKVTACDTANARVVSCSLPTGASTEATLSTLNGKVTAVNTGAVVISSSALPSGAATETTLAALNAKFPTALVFSNAGANSTLNIKASTGAVYSFYCKNANAASRFIQFWNSATDATAGSNLIEFEVTATTTLVIGSDFFLQNGLAFSTGIAFGFSSTSGTYTAATASDMRLLVRYV